MPKSVPLMANVRVLCKKKALYVYFLVGALCEAVSVGMSAPSSLVDNGAQDGGTGEEDHQHVK